MDGLLAFDGAVLTVYAELLTVPVGFLAVLLGLLAFGKDLFAELETTPVLY